MTDQIGKTGKTDAAAAAGPRYTTEQVTDLLRSHGLRITSQRKVILDVILAGNCTCTKEVYIEARRRSPGIGIATVYRMVSLLVEIGVLQAAKIQLT